MSRTEKTFATILKAGLLLAPFLVLVVTRSLYFPFITGKNFAFRILIEILAAIWVVGALSFPNLRPKVSAITWAVLFFIAVMGLATIFSISPYRSFWSNFERMEGYMALLHLFLYFLLLGTVFNTERDWRIFFLVSIGVSVIVSLYGVGQLLGLFDIHQGGTRVDATLGNATYLAVYLLFHLFLLIWFFLRSSKLAARLGYAAIFILEAVILYHTATRGAILGLLGGLLILFFFLALRSRGLVRQTAFVVMAAVIILPLLFFAVRKTDFVQKSPVLVRFATISLHETTTQARFTVWGMALKGWRERPILGWGQESFLTVFSKYYEPSLWPQEPWFDRAHNVFLDWLIAGGILGLFAYLGMFAAGGAVLWRGLRRGIFDAIAFGVLISLLAAYFFQNLFVFDNMTSYLLFFAVLAYLHTRDLEYARLDVVSNAGVNKERLRRRSISAAAQGAAAVVITILLIFLLYFANVKPILAAKSILDGLKIAQIAPPAGKVDAMMQTFQSGLDLNTYGTMEIREQISQAATNYVLRDQTLAAQDKIKFFDFAIRELEAQRQEFPYDVRAKAFLVSLYLSSGRYADALSVAEEAIQSSPRRPQFYFLAAEALINTGQAEKGADLLRYAYTLAPDYPEAQVNLVVGLILSHRGREAEAFLQEHFGSRVLPEPRYARAYTQAGDLARAAEIWKLIVAKSPNDYESRVQLGLVYARLGRASDAVDEINQAIQLEPRFSDQGQALIREIQSGQIR